MSISNDFKNVFIKRDNGLMRLLIINAVVFVLINIIDLFFPISLWLSLPSSLPVYLSRFWTVFTYMFLHKDIWHIFFNMLWLYWMGQLFVDFLGSKRLVSIYILGGLSGGILYFLVSHLIWGSETHFALLGASASVMAIVVAIAAFIPNYSMHLMFLGPVQIKYIALVSFILTTLLDFNVNTGGKIAHLGGAVFGYIFTVLYKRGNDITKPVNLLLEKISGMFSAQGRRNMKVAYKRDTVVTNKTNLQQRTDEILDKITRSGYESLTKEEKDILFKASNNK